MKKIPIIGSGFAAAIATCKFSKINAKVEISAIAPGDEFVYLLGLSPCGRRARADLRFLIKAVHHRVRPIKTAIRKINIHSVKINPSEGAFDYLPIALAAVFIQKGVQEQAIIPCVDIDTRMASFAHGFVAGDADSFAPPDWTTKQANITDLQAAAKNAHRFVNGTTPMHAFKTKLICIVDALNAGILAFRNLRFKPVLKGRFFHVRMVFFERLYLHRIQRGR